LFISSRHRTLSSAWFEESSSRDRVLPECFQKHLQALCRHQSVSGSTRSGSTRKLSAGFLPAPKCLWKHSAAGRVLLEALGSSPPASACFRKHLKARCRHQSASGNTRASSLPAPECVRKHAEALCRRQSACESTRKHVAGGRALWEAVASSLRASTLPPPECVRQHVCASAAAAGVRA